MRVSASRERVRYKALIEENSYSIVKIHNAGDDPLSPCLEGAKLETAYSRGTGIVSKFRYLIDFLLKIEHSLSRVQVN